MSPGQPNPTCQVPLRPATFAGVMFSNAIHAITGGIIGSPGPQNTADPLMAATRTGRLRDAPPAVISSPPKKGKLDNELRQLHPGGVAEVQIAEGPRLRSGRFEVSPCRP